MIYGDDDFEECLAKFKKKRVTDDKVFGDGKFREEYGRKADLWKELIAEEGARFDFLEKIFGDV